MPERMSHIERVKAALAGAPVDRVPGSMWRHFFDKEATTDGLVEAMVGFQKRYDWDFMKVNPRAHYHCQDWGQVFRYSGSPYESPTMEVTPIQKASDWANIKPLNPTSGTLGAHLDALRRINKELKGQVPLLMTVFGPLGVASHMVPSEEVMLRHMQEDPKSVVAALEAITETFVAYVPRCLEAGAAGLFFATTSWGTYDRLTDAQYNEFCRPYDMRVLAATKGAWFHMLHVCRGHNMLRRLTDYPVHAFNWDSLDPTNATLKEGLSFTTRAVVGGIPHRAVLEMMKPEQARKYVADALAQTGGRRFMFGTGCTFSPKASDNVVQAFQQAIAGGGKA